MSDWTTELVGQVLPFKYGKTLPERERTHTGEYQVVSSAGIIDTHRLPLTNKPTIVIGRKGSIGTVYYCPSPVFPIDTTFYVEESEKIDIRFAYYLLKHLPLGVMNNDSAVPGLNRTQAENIKVSLPPLPEQRGIAATLGALDDKIESNRRISQTLEQLAITLFKSWFVDFDPVWAKVENRVTYIPHNIAELFSDTFEESDFGEIPSGWVVRNLDAMLSALVSGSRPTGGAIDEGVPSVGAENIISIGRYDYSKEKFIPLEHYERLKLRGANITGGDVLLYKDGAYIGKKTYFDLGFPHDECAVNEHVFILRCQQPSYQRYLYFWLDQPELTERLKSLNSNSAQPGINKVGVKGLPILDPGYELVCVFDLLCKPITDMICKLALENKTLSSLRDTLLPELLSGRIRVPEAKEAVEEVL